DGRRARSAIGLDHVAIDLDLPLAKGCEIGHCPQAPADQALDLMGTPTLSAPHRFAITPRMGRPRQHAVLGGHPASPTVTQEGRHAVVYRGRAENMSVAKTREARALGILVGSRLQNDGAQLIGRAAIGTHIASSFAGWPQANATGRRLPV